MARGFSGTSQYIDCGGASGALNISGVKTCCCWIYPTTLPSTSTEHYSFFSKGYDGTHQSFDLTFRDDANVGFQPAISWTSAITLCAWNYGSSIAVNNWYHIAGLNDGTNDKLYVNATVRATAANTSTQSNEKVLVGGIFSSGSPVNLFKGRVADAAIWNTNLTAAEIDALARGTRPYLVRPLSLVGYWPLDGLQSPEPDLSTGGHNGTVTSATAVAGPPINLLSPRARNEDLPASVAFNAAWASQSNLPVIGAGIY